VSPWPVPTGALAEALACTRYLLETPVHAGLGRLGSRLREGITRAIIDAAVQAQVCQLGSH
jgi:glutamate-1-semialdehyde aminotransferase